MSRNRGPPDLQIFRISEPARGHPNAFWKKRLGDTFYNVPVETKDLHKCSFNLCNVWKIFKCLCCNSRSLGLAPDFNLNTIFIVVAGATINFLQNVCQGEVMSIRKRQCNNGDNLFKVSRNSFFAHAMASDFRVAWQYSQREQLIFCNKLDA